MFGALKPRKPLSELEHLIMRVLWQRASATAEAVRLTLAARHAMKESPGRPAPAAEAGRVAPCRTGPPATRTGVGAVVVAGMLVSVVLSPGRPPLALRILPAAAAPIASDPPSAAVAAPAPAPGAPQPHPS